MTEALFDQRPLVIAIAGPNGAGKSTFFEAFLSRTGLRFINADVLAATCQMSAYQAAECAAVLRQQLVSQQESFIFETVLSDPVGEKVGFLQQLAQDGYTVVLCFIGISNWQVSQERVAMRVTQGGHDVPDDKLQGRYPRIMANLKRACEVLPHVRIYDNDDLNDPYKLVGIAESGQVTPQLATMPTWWPC